MNFKFYNCKLINFVKTTHTFISSKFVYFFLNLIIYLNIELWFQRHKIILNRYENWIENNYGFILVWKFFNFWLILYDVMYFIHYSLKHLTIFLQFSWKWKVIYQLKLTPLDLLATMLHVCACRYVFPRSRSFREIRKSFGRAACVYKFQTRSSRVIERQSTFIRITRRWKIDRTWHAWFHRFSTLFPFTYVSTSRSFARSSLKMFESVRHYHAINWQRNFHFQLDEK